MLGKGDYEDNSILQMQQNGADRPEIELVPAQNEEYMNFIIRYSKNIHGPVDYSSDGTFQIINDTYAVLYFPVEEIGALEINSYSYSSIPKCYTYMDTESLNTSGISRLQNHPYLQLRGQGTMVAVIDSGIDYQNSLFINSAGSRILEIWDQTELNGASEFVPFGRVYTKKELDEALGKDNPQELVPAMDQNGHGTRMAAIAAGNYVPEEDFSGAAPEASLVVIKLKPAKQYLRNFYLLPADAEVYQEDDIMLALAYAMRCAQRYRLPLSVCIGLGTNQGSHLGQSPLSQFIDRAAGFAQNSVSIAAGNEGSARHHYYGILEKNTPSKIVELRIGERNPGFIMEFWGNAPEQFMITIQSPTGEDLEVSTSLKGTTQELSFVFVETKVFVNYVPIERRSGNTLFYFRFIKPAAGIWKLQIRGRDTNRSVFHMWLPVRGFLADDTFFLEASPYYTVTAPGDSLDGITMTAYSQNDGSLFQQASRGFLADEEVKPDLSAPGVNVKVPLLNGGYGVASGTSLAAAQTAGTAALMFEWALVRGNAPYFTGDNVKNYLTRGAVRLENMSYPNEEWGYGKIDLYRTFELLT